MFSSRPTKSVCAEIGLAKLQFRNRVLAGVLGGVRADDRDCGADTPSLRRANPPPAEVWALWGDGEFVLRLQRFPVTSFRVLKPAQRHLRATVLETGPLHFRIRKLTPKP